MAQAPSRGTYRGWSRPCSERSGTATALGSKGRSACGDGSREPAKGMSAARADNGERLSASAWRPGFSGLSAWPQRGSTCRTGWSRT